MKALPDQWSIPRALLVGAAVGLVYAAGQSLLAVLPWSADGLARRGGWLVGGAAIGAFWGGIIATVRNWMRRSSR